MCPNVERESCPKVALAPSAHHEDFEENTILPPPITEVGMTWETAVDLGRVT